MNLSPSPPDPSMRLRVLALLMLGVAAELAWIAVLLLGDLRFELALFTVLFCTAGVVMVMAARVLWTARTNRGLVLLVIAFAFLFRCTIFLSAPTLSDDVYRYVWEGRLVLDARNPFHLPPDADEHSDLRDPDHGRINHSGMTTIYPPAALSVFTLSQVLGRGPVTMKLLAVSADMLLIALLVQLLTARGRNPSLVVLYAWHPLPIVEFAGSAHLDVFAITLMMAAFLMLERDRLRWASVLLTLSGLTKLFAFALGPAVARRTGWRPLLTIGGVVTVLAVLPFIGAGGGLVRSVFRYASSWRFNGSVFDILELVLGSGNAARMVVVVGFALLAVVLPRRCDDPLKVAAVLAAAFVMLSPTVHPWYVVWLIPFLCFFPRMSWLYLSVAVVFAYRAVGHLVHTGVWLEEPWVRALEYGPFVLLFVLEVVAGRRGHPRPATPPMRRDSEGRR